MRAGRGRSPQKDMSAEEVVEILDSIDAEGGTPWLDGGWAVDALVGRQTRAHDDLDLVVLLDELGAVEWGIYVLGYTRLGGEPPYSFECVDRAGRQVDVHPIAADGSYRMRNDTVWRYPLPDREAFGTVGGRRVRCLDAETQLVCHTGYEPLDLGLHRHDVALIESLRV